MVIVMQARMGKTPGFPKLAAKHLIICTLLKIGVSG
jgi:hypothetical protein